MNATPSHLGHQRENGAQLVPMRSRLAAALAGMDAWFRDDSALDELDRARQELASILDATANSDPQPDDASRSTGDTEPEAAAPRTVWAYIQEGGSSDELYVHVRDTEQDAHEARRSCADDGGYRTTEPVALPEDTDWSAVEELVQSLDTLGFPKA